MKKKSAAAGNEVDERQAVALHLRIAALMREFKLEPGLLAGSVYSDLHVNDVGLFEALSEPGAWNVRAIATALAVPITTVSSALDRLERRGLIARTRIAADRRIVRIQLTPIGHSLTGPPPKPHIH